MCRSITTFILIGSFFVVGCGPITSQGIIKEARIAIDKAEKQGANIGAPYELFGALERYKKAREEQGYSDYQAAIDLAKEALKLAETAYAKTVAGGDPLQRIDPERRKALKKRSSK